MDHDEVTAQILGAWEDTVAEQTEPETEPKPETGEPTPEVEEPATEESEEPEEESEEEEPEDEDEEEDEEEEEEGAEEGEPVVAYETDDIEIRAFLAKYEGDLDKALRGAADLHRLVGRQGQEKNYLTERVSELEAELERMRAFASFGGAFSEEQREWIETAASSGNPAGYINQALEQGEFELARAVVQEWAREDPYNAMRAGQFIDQTESSAASYVEPIDMGRLLDALKTEIPELPNYSLQMAQVVRTLGDDHPLVQDARSADLQLAANAIVRIYEYAKASSATVTRAREQVRAEQRENGAVAKRKAVVSSASASPSATETPRAVRLGPGLTLEQLEAEFAAATQQ